MPRPGEFMWALNKGKAKAGILWFLCFTGGALAHAQARYPFPQNITYPYGIMPSSRNHLHAESSYVRWKNSYVTTNGACGYRRVLFNDMTTTYSEGIGYGMLLAATFGDRALFDDLWNYYKAHLDINGLMHWWIGASCGTIISGTAATDADEDAAFALILAHHQWDSSGANNYRDEAITLINRIFQHEVEESTYVLKPGDMWGGSHVLNPSYLAPAYYRVFAELTGNTAWYRVIDTCYQILQNAAHPVTGLVPDWCQANGQPAPGFGYYYYYDATRTPWRIALDYLWFGEPRAKAFCERISGFARGVGANNIAEGYQLNGSPMGSQHNNVFVGPFGVGAMATNAQFQAFVDSAYEENVITVLPTGYGYYYNWSLKTLTLLVQTGNFLCPLTDPLPVQLAYFRAELNQPRTAVLLEWGTLSELNNYGFEVQRRTANDTVFRTLPHGFVPGHGTTGVPQFYSFADSNMPSGVLYYRLKQIDLDGRFHFTDAVRVDVLLAVQRSHRAARFALEQNYPNPVNPTTTIRFEIPELGQTVGDVKATLKVYDVLGRDVATLVREDLAPGRYEVTWTAEGFSSGVYVYRLQAGPFVAERKLIILR